MLLENQPINISDKLFLFVNTQLAQRKGFLFSQWACSDKFIYFGTQPVYYGLYQRKNYKFC